MLVPRRWIAFCALIFCCAGRVDAGSLNATQLQGQLNRLAEGFDGRVGVCAVDSHGPVRVAGDERFSMHSVMKLIVAMAAMGAMDHCQMHLQDPIRVRREDLSVFVQPMEIGDPRASKPARAALIAQLGASTIAHYD